MDPEEQRLQEDANTINLLNIYINLMQQTETKQMTTIGFYFAGIIALYSSSIFFSNRTLTTVIAVVLGLITSYIAGSFWNWKRDYLRSAQILISRLHNFNDLRQNGEIPSSLRNPIEQPDTYSIDWFLVSVPLFITISLFFLELHLLFYIKN
ncbi:hypothetical protein [Leptospira harrisiae]|uniref:hypothetical protein n=1 Tax=Leptospira harrisiae TaxID=2023189 RepID=UPI000C2A8509|nr:hypothetical protein [Leptospira harrisiae]PKA06490.1 hypothetical protein CH366_18770 [Leptospira harrisiae]